MGHHSTSDDSSQYRLPNEMSLWQKSGLDGIGESDVHMFCSRFTRCFFFFLMPLARLRLYLEKKNLWDATKESELRKSAKEYLLKLIKQAEQRKTVPIISGVFDKVYDENPWNLKVCFFC
jgi:2-oxoisovalerate dehydrogenase E1 component alpha subunit